MPVPRVRRLAQSRGGGDATAAAPGTPGPRGAEREREAPAALAPPMVALKVLLAEDNEVNQRIAWRC